MNQQQLSSAFRRPAVAGAAALAAVGLAVWLVPHSGSAQSKKGADKNAANAPVPVLLAKVEERTVPTYLTGTGNVTAAATVTVKARVDGQLEKVGFDEGQDVKAGQVLAQLDPRPLQAQLAQVSAQKASDEAKLVNAQLDLKRYEQLIKDDATTQQTLDTQRALVGQLQAALKTDDAQIQYAKVQLDYTTIRSPMDGRTGVRLVDPGNIVHAADANGIVVVNQIDPITVLFTLPDAAVPQVNQAFGDARHPLLVQAYTRDNAQLLGDGALLLVNNQIDVASGTVQLKARFPNRQHLMWPGQYVNVRLVLGAKQKSIVVPAQAVQRSQDGLYTYVVAPDRTARMQPVKVAQIQDGIAVVTEGLQPGEQVVLDGQYKLHPGAQVVAATAANAPAPAASSGAAKP